MTGFSCLKEAEGLGPQAGQHVPWDLGEAEARKGPGEEVEEEQGKDKKFRFSVSHLLVLTLPVTCMLLNTSSEKNNNLFDKHFFAKCFLAVLKKLRVPSGIL